MTAVTDSDWGWASKPGRGRYGVRQITDRERANNAFTEEDNVRVVWFITATQPRAIGTSIMNAPLHSDRQWLAWALRSCRGAAYSYQRRNRSALR